MPLHILTGVRVLLLGARVWSWNEGASVGASVLPPPALALALACLRRSRRAWIRCQIRVGGLVRLDRRRRASTTPGAAASRTSNSSSSRAAVCRLGRRCHRTGVRLDRMVGCFLP